MNNNKYDKKKIIEMVAVIGILCVFVGVATKLRQNSIKTVADYANKNPEVAYAESEKHKDDVDEDTQSDINSSSNNNSGSDKKSDTESESNDTDLGTNSVLDMTEDEYNNFYYIDLDEETVLMHIYYYNSKHEVSIAEIKVSAENADDTLRLYYDLYKAGHDFSDVDELTKLSH